MIVKDINRVAVVDTNILLLDAGNINAIGRNYDAVVLPSIVLEECDSKKNGYGEVAYQARSVGRYLAQCTVTDVKTTGPEGTGDVWTKLMHNDGTVILVVKLYDYGVRVGEDSYNDKRIINTAKAVVDNGYDVVFFSNDVMARLNAMSTGLVVEEFKISDKDEYEFVREVKIDDEEMFSRLHNSKIEDVVDEVNTENYSYKFTSSQSGQVKLATISNGYINVIGRDTEKLLRKQMVASINAEQLLVSKAIQDENIDMVLIEGPAGSGKAQPNSERVLTDKGWTTIGEIRPGDKVIGSDGKAKNVTAIYPQGERDIYKVSFIDGTEVLCDIDHIWSVRERTKGMRDSGYKNVTVREMLNTWIRKDRYDKRYGTYRSYYNFSIPKAEACEFSNGMKLPIDPYVIGLLLGGELPVDKHIPSEYLYNSLENRKALWQGLTDTGGNVDKNGIVKEYSTSSEQLAKDYLELSRSLGKVFTINSRHKGELKEGHKSWRLRQMANKPKSIVAIEYSHRENATCISVDSSDHLYITNGYNLTHNTIVAFSNAIRIMQMNKDKYQKLVYVRSPTNDEDLGEDIGYLAGNTEKMDLYLGAAKDTLDFMMRSCTPYKSGKKADYDIKIENKVAEMVKNYGIDTIITTGLRGRTFHNAVIILDEATNYSPATMQKVLTRVGKDCKVIVIGSKRQIDNKYLSVYNNGMALLMDEACRKEINCDVEMFAIQLSKVVRSKMAMFAEELFTKKKCG